MINSWDSLYSNLYGVEALTFKWISNTRTHLRIADIGVEALNFKWISNDLRSCTSLTSGVDALTFKMKSILSHRLDRACAKRLAGLADIEFYHISRQV